jgi:hypothetical protein
MNHSLSGVVSPWRQGLGQAAQDMPETPADRSHGKALHEDRKQHKAIDYAMRAMHLRRQITKKMAQLDAPCKGTRHVAKQHFLGELKNGACRGDLGGRAARTTSVGTPLRRAAKLLASRRLNQIDR